MPPDANAYDMVVIGAGPAGQSAAELDAHFGRTVLIIENDAPGGAVATTGGAPTKTLREAALYLTGFRQEEVYGAQAAITIDAALPIIARRARDACRVVAGNRWKADRGARGRLPQRDRSTTPTRSSR